MLLSFRSKKHLGHGNLVENKTLKVNNMNPEYNPNPQDLLYNERHSTVTITTTYGVFNPPANLRSTITVKTTSLVGRPYSIYQHKLATQIIYLREEKGMAFSYIAEWLNKNGYTTPGGKNFTNPHAHSIYTKFYKRQERFGKISYSQFSEISVRYNKSAD